MIEDAAVAAEAAGADRNVALGAPAVSVEVRNTGAEMAGSDADNKAAAANTSLPKRPGITPGRLSFAVQYGGGAADVTGEVQEPIYRDDADVWARPRCR